MEVDTTVTLYNFYGWLRLNQKRVVAGAVVVGVIAAIIGAVMWNNSQKRAGANQALFSDPAFISGPAVADAATAKTLLSIGQEYSGVSAGACAQLLGARALFLSGKYAEAEAAFSKFAADNADNPLVPQAAVGIAASLEAQGKINPAIAQYKKIDEMYSRYPNIVLPVKLTLGRLSEADNKPDQAVKYYRDLAGVRDPNDPWVAEAAERYRLLVTKHPELAPPPPQASGAAPRGMMAPSEAELQLSAPPGSAGPATQPPTAPPATNSPPAGKP